MKTFSRFLFLMNFFAAVTNAIHDNTMSWVNIFLSCIAMAMLYGSLGLEDSEKK